MFEESFRAGERVFGLWVINGTDELLGVMGWSVGLGTVGLLAWGFGLVFFH